MGSRGPLSPDGGRNSAGASYVKARVTLSILRHREGSHAQNPNASTKGWIFSFLNKFGAIAGGKIKTTKLGAREMEGKIKRGCGPTEAFQAWRHHQRLAEMNPDLCHSCDRRARVSDRESGMAAQARHSGLVEPLT